MAGEPPLKGIRVIEFAGLAPGPFAGMMLADAGASVLRIDRPPSPDAPAPPAGDLLTRHKRSAAIDLKNPKGAALVRELAARADVLIDPCCGANPRLVYGRLTGFRRDGRFAAMAGHDINYLAVSGALALLGRRGGPPTPPANLLGDFAAGGAMLVHGILMALLARERTGRGQVVEANMVDGASYLATFARLARRTPVWDRPRGENLLDSGCPFYDCYETADGRWVAGPGVEGRGYAARPLDPGRGGEEALGEWLGWSRGVQFDVEDGGLVLKDRARL
ncbi:hypothetical protein VTH06DRAFT_6509 [Thermothelomyces fergusii]